MVRATSNWKAQERPNVRTRKREIRMSCPARPETSNFSTRLLESSPRYCGGLRAILVPVFRGLLSAKAVCGLVGTPGPAEHRGSEPRALGRSTCMATPPIPFLESRESKNPPPIYMPVTARWTKASAAMTRKSTTDRSIQPRPACAATPNMPPAPAK